MGRTVINRDFESSMSPGEEFRSEGIELLDSKKNDGEDGLVMAYILSNDMKSPCRKRIWNLRDSGWWALLVGFALFLVASPGLPFLGVTSGAEANAELKSASSTGDLKLCETLLGSDSLVNADVAVLAEGAVAGIAAKCGLGTFGNYVCYGAPRGCS